MTFRKLCVCFLMTSFLLGCSSTTESDKPSSLAAAGDAWLNVEGLRAEARDKGLAYSCWYSIAIHFEGDEEQVTRSRAKWNASKRHDTLRAISDRVISSHNVLEMGDERVQKTFAADLRDELNLLIRDQVENVVVYDVSFEDAVEQYSGKSDPMEDSWLLLEGITTPVQVGEGHGSSTTVRYSLGIRFEGGQAQQTEVITKWQQGNNLMILRGLADDVMKKYDMDRVRDESFKRTYSAELKKELNIQIADDVKRIMVYELRYD